MNFKINIFRLLLLASGKLLLMCIYFITRALWKAFPSLITGMSEAGFAVWLLGKFMKPTCYDPVNTFRKKTLMIHIYVIYQDICQTNQNCRLTNKIIHIKKILDTHLWNINALWTFLNRNLTFFSQWQLKYIQKTNRSTNIIKLGEM